MGEGGRRPGEGSYCLPALRRGGFLQQNESDILIELEQRALIRPSGTFSHATRGRRGKFGTPESRLTKFNHIIASTGISHQPTNFPRTVLHCFATGEGESWRGSLLGLVFPGQSFFPWRREECCKSLA